MLLLGSATAPLVPRSREAAPHPGAGAPVDIVQGSVLLPDEGSPAGMYAYLSSRSRIDSIAIGESGAFALAVAEGHCGPIDLRIDVPAGSERRYHAAVIRLASAAQYAGRMVEGGRVDALGRLRILLVPTRVVIDGGTYSGTVVPIHVDAALAAEWERPRFWRVSRSARSGYGTPVAWPEGHFPIPVVLRARGGVRSADSAAFWRTARQLEADFGRSLFQPIADEPDAEEIWRITVAVEPLAGAAGLTFTTYGSDGGIYEATIAIRSPGYFSDARLITHELVHGLGFGHSTAWYSAMGPPHGAASRVTAADVGYAQLLYRLRRTHVTQEATHGVLASSAEGRRAVSAGASLCAQ